jgi:hypothetical protein
MSRWDGDNYLMVDQVYGPRQGLGPDDRILRSDVLECKGR